jgi:hypothetical protein
MWTNSDDLGPRAKPHKASGQLKQLARSALLSLAINSSPATARCLLPEAFNHYFQLALNDVSSTLDTLVIEGLEEIGFGPVGALSLNDFVNFKEQVFEPLFGTEEERNGWINVTADLDVKAQLQANLESVVGFTLPELSVKCKDENTDDLGRDELPYRFAMEFKLFGTLLGTDLDLASLSRSIALLPEDTFDPLSFTVENLSADYSVILPLSLDIKRRKFMIGEIKIAFDADLSANVLQEITLTETVSQDFGGNLDMNIEFSYSSTSDWAYTAGYNASLTAETSVGTAVAELGLFAHDDDLFDDKPRELAHILQLMQCCDHSNTLSHTSRFVCVCSICTF